MPPPDGDALIGSNGGGQATKLADGYEPALGDAGLAGAVHSFATDWAIHRARLLDDLEQESKLADTAVKAYHGTDDQLAAGLHKQEEAGSGERLMGRPADWSPLADNDPVPGDPEEVAALGRRFRATAAGIEQASARLRTMCTDEFWEPGAGAEFRGPLQPRGRPAQRGPGPARPGRADP